MTTLFIGLLMILVGIANNRLKLYKLKIFSSLLVRSNNQRGSKENKAKALEKSLVLCGSLMIIANLLIQYFDVQSLELYVFWVFFILALTLNYYFEILINKRK